MREGDKEANQQQEERGTETKRETYTETTRDTYTETTRETYTETTRVTYTETTRETYTETKRGRETRQARHLALCFFVLCNRQWFNRVPGAHLGIACLPSALTLTLAVPTYP